MSEDIVERLRQLAGDAAVASSLSTWDRNDIWNEAADKIERLRAELDVAKKFMDKDAEDYDSLRAEIERLKSGLPITCLEALEQDNPNSWEGTPLEEIKRLRAENERLRAALDQEQHAASFIAEAKAEIERLRTMMEGVRDANAQDTGNDGGRKKDPGRAGDRTTDRQIPKAAAGK